MIMKKARKPTMKDKVTGVFAFSKELVINLFKMNFALVKLNWMCIKLTLRGGFEIVEE